MPTPPDLSVGSDLLLSALFQATQPTFSFQIDESLSTTCGNKGPRPSDKCSRSRNADRQPIYARSTTPPGLDVLSSGAVGPFEFMTLQLADGEEDDPSLIFDWLETNGYDQPDQSEPLISYYAGMGMIFVALRLRKDSNEGDIRPLILRYSVSGTLSDTPVACVPIQLTAIAETPKMPIQIYTLGPSRGVPLNFFHVELDDRYLDWMKCQRSGVCLRNSYQTLFEAAIRDVRGHAFVTEFAGPSVPILSDILPGRISAADFNELVSQSDASSFLAMLTSFGILGIPDLINSIVEGYMRSIDCPSRSMYPRPQWQSGCTEFTATNDTNVTIDFRAIAQELDDQIFQPARDAQDWLDSYDYMTRLYAKLDPRQMTKDPFFAFNSGLPDVSRVHAAVGVPICKGRRKKKGVGMEIRIINGTTSSAAGNTRVDARVTCSRMPGTTVWEIAAEASDFLCRMPDDGDSPSNPRAAFSLGSLSFTGEPIHILEANGESGTYLESDIQKLVEIMDRRVPDQVGWRAGSGLPTEAEINTSAGLPECVGVYHDAAAPRMMSRHVFWSTVLSSVIVTTTLVTL